ncbi:hypothetical protein B9479_001530 [Cryptococcus floricola]|uniref:Thaumatin-like protein 1 n=1 Tax=Cryptococcus floricola TaxID=2591691 RepID=A0A5D3B5V3_9TREE|nr:hypothetical protein B9479_001530 [Cryptococcus floricola]
MPLFSHSSLSPVALLILLISTTVLPTTLAERKITVNNKCSSSLYLAVGGQGGNVTKSDGSAQPGGWEQEPGEYTFIAPDGWNNARIWARTGCEKSGDSLDCIIGACTAGTIECDGTEFGTAGATLAEFTLNGYSGQDSYDISIVDGYNLPVTITPSDSSCTRSSCGAETDILTQCDPYLAYPQGNDKIYSCNSACGNSFQFQDLTSGAFISADTDNSPVCCRQGGDGVASEDCPNTYIPFYKTMKSMCQDGYVYADDDLYEGAVFSCAGTDDLSYTVTFCPSGDGAGLDPPSLSSASSQDSSPGDNTGNLQNAPDEASIWASGVTGTPISSIAGASDGSSANTSSATSAGASSGVGSAAVSRTGGVSSDAASSTLAAGGTSSSDIAASSAMASSGAAVATTSAGAAAATAAISPVSSSAAAAVNPASSSAAAVDPAASSVAVPAYSSQAWGGGGAGGGGHSGGGWIGAIQVATSSPAPVAPVSTSVPAEGVTTTYTSDGNVYVQVNVVETQAVQGRNLDGMGSLKGKRWLGERDIE